MALTVAATHGSGPRERGPRALETPSTVPSEMAEATTRPVGKKADEAPIWSTAFDAREVLRGRLDDTTVRQAVAPGRGGRP